MPLKEGFWIRTGPLVNCLAVGIFDQSRQGNGLFVVHQQIRRSRARDKSNVPLVVDEFDASMSRISTLSNTSIFPSRMVGVTVILTPYCV